MAAVACCMGYGQRQPWKKVIGCFYLMHLKPLRTLEFSAFTVSLQYFYLHVFSLGDYVLTCKCVFQILYFHWWR